MATFRLPHRVIDDLHLASGRSNHANGAASGQRPPGAPQMSIRRTLIDADQAAFVVRVSDDAPDAYDLVIVLEQSILTAGWLRHLESQEAAILLGEEIARFSGGTVALDGRQFLFRAPYADASISEAISNVRMLGADAFGIG